METEFLYVKKEFNNMWREKKFNETHGVIKQIFSKN